MRKPKDGNLRHLLTKAARRLAAVRGPIWSEYDSGFEVAQFVRQCRDDIEHGTLAAFQGRELWRIFARNHDWDRITGDVELGNEVFRLVDKLFGDEVKEG
jgi:hypothetical protein